MGADFNKHIKEMLELGSHEISANPKLTKETKFINVEGENSIAIDLRLEAILIGYISKNRLPVKIFSEEKGYINIHSKPKFLIALDPLDGTTNYKVGNGMLPFGTLIAVYKGLKPKLKNVIAAGAIEYTQSVGWLYSNGQTTDLNGKKIHIRSDWKTHYTTPIYLDLYYKEGYEAYRSLARKLFIRNVGSTIGGLSYLLSNVASGIGSMCMRAEEIGTIVALVTGAGGTVVDNKGRGLSEKRFSPKRTYQILAGANKIVNFAVGELSN